jgi:hypothetical protein
MSIVWETETNANSYYVARTQEIKYDSEGNIILAGYSWYGIYNSNQTVFVAKINSENGEIIWLQRYMGEDIGDYDNGTVNGLYLDNEDNVILFAKYFSQKVIKYDKDGNFISMDDYKFDLPFTINVYNNDILFDKVHKDPSSNYHVGGIITDYDKVYSYYAQFTPQGAYWKHKTDTLNVIEYHMGSSVISLYDDFKIHLVGRGYTDPGSNTKYGIVLSSINTEGNCTWGSPNWYEDYERYPLKILKANDGTFYVTIYFGNSSGDSRGTYLSKYDPAGDLIWERKIDTIQVADMEFDKGGNIWLVGSGTSSNVTARIKYSAAGERTFYKLDEDSFAAGNLLVNEDNDIYYTAHNFQGVYVQKYDWKGDFLAEIKISNNYNFLYNSILAFDPKGDLIVCSDWQEDIFIKKISDLMVDVKENNILPTEFSLSQNYPNPFNPTTIIEYSVPSTEYVSLKVYDILGKEVADLINQQMNPGSYEIEFDASQLSSGIYFYKLAFSSKVITKKMAFIK